MSYEKRAREIADNWNDSDDGDVGLHLLTISIAKALREAHEAGRQSVIAEVMPVLEFYGDYMNYSIDYDTSQNGFTRRCILYSDIEERNEASGLAGKRARALRDKLSAEGEK